MLFTSLNIFPICPVSSLTSLKPSVFQIKMLKEDSGKGDSKVQSLGESLTKSLLEENVWILTAQRSTEI